MIWTDAQTERLKELFAEGYSCSQIAADIGGTSRNAVIGKIHRLGLRPKPIKSKTANKKNGRRVTNPMQTRRFAKVVRNVNGHVVMDAYSVTLPESASQSEVAPGTQFKRLLDLEHGDCRFPLGDVGDPSFAFCAARAVPTYPYCAHHCRIAYTGIPVRRDRVRVR